MGTIGTGRAARLRRLGALVAAIAVVVVVVLLVRGGDDGARGPASGTARVVVDRLGRKVPPSFAGLSMEWDTLDAYAGRRPDALARLLAPVERAAGSPLRLRIGGDSADQAWWNPGARRPKPPTVLQDVGPATLDDVAWLARALGGGPVTLGVNLALRDPANAADLIRAARARLPKRALAGIEIGNEPDLYAHGRTFTQGGHVHRRLTKDPNYDLDAYTRDAGAYLRALQPVAGGAALTVAGFATPTWWPALPGLLDGWGGRAGAFAAHLYAQPNCEAPTPSEAWLAGRSSSRSRVASLEPLLRIARDRKVPVDVSELNSAACGGRPGLTDQPVAALWTADTLMALARAGARSADLHTWAGAAYAPFVVGTGGRVTAKPPLTGMEAFARAAPSGSRLARTITSGAIRGGATVARDGSVRLLLITRRQAKATFRLTRAGSTKARRTECATAWQAPPSGRASSIRLCPAADGTFALPMPATSIAVITVPRAATA